MGRSNLSEWIEHPFGKGALTTTGAQYCTAVTGIDNDAYDAIETATITLPTNITIEEIEFGLTCACEVDGSGSSNDVLWKWQGSDDNSSWDDLIAEQTLSNTNTFTDLTIAGRFDIGSGTNFTGANPFYVRLVIKSSGATDTVSGKTKNSSYIIVKYTLL